MSKLFILIIMVVVTTCYELLQEIPITFKLNGNVSYTPSSGGVNIPGYKLKIGFYKYSWIGVKFQALTSRSNYDVIVVTRDSSNVGGYYQTLYNDYFVSSARQTQLLSDSVNSMDKSVQTYTNNNYFQIEIFRTKGNTQGQDWQGGNFVKVCFYTSDNNFDQNIWTNLYESCYGYDINNDYISTFRGKYINSMQFDGVNTEVYGGIQGPVLQMILFWYCPKSSLSSSDIFIRTGGQISSSLGYDYYKCGTGDYFGPDLNSLTLDTLWSGYNDGQCAISNSAGSTKIAYSKLVYTNDQFDSILNTQTQICVTVGTNNACKTLKFQILCPIMSVDSALVVWEFNIKVKILAITLFLIVFSFK